MKIEAITLKMIRYFNILGEELHFGKAAQRLFISQPSLTAQIQEFESLLGYKLFNRNSRHVQFTAMGYETFKKTQEIIEKINQSFDNLYALEHQENEHLSLGVVSSILQSSFLKILEKIKEKAPNMTWDFEELSPKEQMISLQQNKIDVAFIRSSKISSMNKNFKAHKILDSFVSIAVHFEDDFVKQALQNKLLSLADFHNKKLVMLKKSNSEYLRKLHKLCLDAGIKKENIMEVVEPFSLLSLVRSRQAIGLISQDMAFDTWADIQVLPLKEKIACNLYMIHHKNMQIEAQKSFVNLFLAFNDKK